MTNPTAPSAITDRFRALYGLDPAVLASAPGRLEVLGNHTDYNNGLTLSCAVNLRCFAAIAPIGGDKIRLASTLFDEPAQSFSLDNPAAGTGHWGGYVLGVLHAMQYRGIEVPGLALLVHADVPPSAGLSSSAALEMSVAKAVDTLLGSALAPLDLARLGQAAESGVVGAQTGLLDQLSALLGRHNHLLQIDFASMQTTSFAIPPGWCFVAVDSGVKHNLTRQYNDRRASCVAAAKAMGVASLRQADRDLLGQHRDGMPQQAARCAKHILGENERVRDATEALSADDMARLGELMFASHLSSRDNFRNSCPELDEMIEFAQADTRCVGARLSGGGFGGVSIHLVKDSDAEDYRQTILNDLARLGRGQRWSAICQTEDGACVHQKTPP